MGKKSWAGRGNEAMGQQLKRLMVDDDLSTQKQRISILGTEVLSTL